MINYRFRSLWFPVARCSTPRCSATQCPPQTQNPQDKGFICRNYFLPQRQWYFKLNLVLRCAHSDTPGLGPQWFFHTDLAAKALHSHTGGISFSVSSSWPLWGQDANSVTCPGCWPQFHLIKTLPLTPNHHLTTAYLHAPRYIGRKVLPMFLFFFSIFS